MTPISSLAGRIRFPEAVLIALLIHLLGLVLIEPVRRLLPAAADLPQVPLQPEPLRFTFVNLPEEVRVEENPEARFLSDADRLARSEEPPDEPGESDIPRSEGNSSMIEITPPETEEGLERTDAAEREPAPPAPENAPAGEAEPAPPGDGGPSPSAPEPEIGVPGDVRLERIREALRELEESSPKGFDTRFESREPSRVREFGGLSFETKNFDWGDYARRLQEIIRSNWRIPLAAQMGEKGKCRFRFTIERDGTVSRIELVQTSGIPALDNAARLALEVSSPFPPLPKRFPGERETVTCGFYYNIPIDR